MRARLVPTDGGPAIDLVKELTLIGRDAACDARLEAKSVSKLHCVLVKTDGLILVRDLGSTNGTRVNGSRVRRAALVPNDWLMIASHCYAVKFGETIDDPPPALPTPELVEPAGSGEHSTVPPPADPVSGPASRRNGLPDHLDAES